MDKKLMTAWKVVILRSLTPEAHYTWDAMIRAILGKQCAEHMSHRAIEGGIPAWSWALDELQVSGDIESWSNHNGHFYKLVKK